MIRFSNSIQNNFKLLNFLNRYNIFSDNKMTKQKQQQQQQQQQPQPSERSQRIVWVDLEMTGLDLTKDCILEMACIITDSELNIIEKGPELVIHRSDEILNSMNSWCIDHHGKSGLTDRVKQSNISIKDAEKQMFEFISKHVDREQCPLAGNSVYQDRKFLEKEMPLFNNHLHYRIIDVSSIKELARRWYPSELKKAPKKEGSHRALKDIEESIEELKFYRTSFFK